MRGTKLASLAIGLCVIGGSFAFLAQGNQPTKPAVRGATGNAITSRITFEAPQTPLLASAMLGVDADNLASTRLTANQLLARTSIPVLAARVADDATLEKRLPDYFSRFDPDEGEFDRAGLARDIASRIALSTEPGSDLIVLRVTADDEQLSRELCDMVAGVFEFQIRDSHTRRLIQASDAVGRMQRTLRTDEAALRAQCENLIINESLQSTDSVGSGHATTLAEVCKRLLDAELELVGKAVDDPAVADQRARLAWLQSRRDELVKQNAVDMHLARLLQAIERELEARESSRVSLDRTLLAYTELLDAPVIHRIERTPVRE